MKIVEINKLKIIHCRKNDLIERGKYCLVFNYWGNIVKLDDCEIWYNNKWKYVKPKSFIPIVKRSSSFLSFF
jgi:hypothetical protein